MAPRKEPKEAVIYPPSKRKPPPFKPLRPSKGKAPITETTSSSSHPSASLRPIAKPRSATGRRATALPVNNASDAIRNPKLLSVIDSEDSQDEQTAPIQQTSDLDKRKSTASHISPVSSLPDDDHDVDHNINDALPTTTREEPEIDFTGIPLIPQPLLLRLLHEAFEDKTMKIDKNAAQMVQEYVNVFVREAIARSAQMKRDAVREGQVMDSDSASWLELEDLEKVAPGLLLDF